MVALRVSTLLFSVTFAAVRLFTLAFTISILVLSLYLLSEISRYVLFPYVLLIRFRYASA